MIELNNLVSLTNVTGSELGLVNGGQQSTLAPISSTNNLQNSITAGVTGNYLTGEKPVVSLNYENARGFGINATSAGDLGFKAPLGNSTSVMGGTNFNTGTYFGSFNYKF